jgi:hypothetical protein
MQGIGGLLRLMLIAFQALLNVAATAHLGSGMFLGVSFG